MVQPGDGVKITIRKKAGEEVSPEYQERLRAEQKAADANAERLARLLAEDGDDEVPRGAEVFVVVKFAHVKPSIATFLKFWLMGGCGAKGWSGTGELEAKHTSGTVASIEIDVDEATVSLLSTSDASYNSQVQLGRYATALLDELEGLAKTEEAAADDRLCYPPEAVDAARASLVPARRS